ncbi:hypothetical protein FO511_00435 [Bacillus paranthracis]|nr:hypothetical protein [Bacillus paranthracis]MDR4393461.1 hypothetical protein [Bacillus paranthracis]TKC21088.1 hypothetical protein CQB03_16635 [Bacillus paranthracis]
MQDAPIIAYAGYPNEMQGYQPSNSICATSKKVSQCLIQDAESNNSICVFVLKSELKLEVLQVTFLMK